MHVHVRGWVGRPQECNLMSPWVDTHRSVLCPLSYIGGHISQFTQQLQLYTIGPFPVFHSPNAEGYICIHQSIFLGLVPTGGIFVNTIHTVFRCLPQFPISVMSLSRLCFGKAGAPGSHELTPEAGRWPSRYLRVTLGAGRGHPSLLSPGFLPCPPCSIPWSTAYPAPSWGYTQPCPRPHPRTTPAPPSHNSASEQRDQALPPS